MSRLHLMALAFLVVPQSIEGQAVTVVDSATGHVVGRGLLAEWNGECRVILPKHLFENRPIDAYLRSTGGETSTGWKLENPPGDSAPLIAVSFNGDKQLTSFCHRLAKGFTAEFAASSAGLHVGRDYRMVIQYGWDTVVSLGPLTLLAKDVPEGRHSLLAFRRPSADRATSHHGHSGSAIVDSRQRVIGLYESVNGDTLFAYSIKAIRRIVSHQYRSTSSHVSLSAALHGSSRNDKISFGPALTFRLERLPGRPGIEVSAMPLSAVGKWRQTDTKSASIGLRIGLRGKLDSPNLRPDLVLGWTRRWYRDQTYAGSTQLKSVSVTQEGPFAGLDLMLRILGPRYTAPPGTFGVALGIRPEIRRYGRPDFGAANSAVARISEESYSAAISARLEVTLNVH